jgi:NDP-4-keto-2,6-dideoxyhexose 3-C-methyltransferase
MDSPHENPARVSYKQIKHCRICKNENLQQVLDLGVQMLTGVFPREKDETITSGPLRLVKCMGDESVCGLLQLEHSFSLSEMYGGNYGYRSGLNASMVAHLEKKVEKILVSTRIGEGDLVLDIGSNDGTTLQAYRQKGLILVGIDPTGEKFRHFYPEHVRLIPDFFSADLVKRSFQRKKAKVITSFSMFYDLEHPLGFMEQIHEVLADDGIWVFEQSYMPSMLRTHSYDTVCHEHLEFYALQQIQWMCDRVGFQIRDVEFNDVNGGSFSVTVAKGSPSRKAQVQSILAEEKAEQLDTLKPYRRFADAAAQSKQQLLSFLERASSEGKRVAALGASTKGNVLLQYCGLTQNDICCVGEVNSDKFGCLTPGTWIPIISESELLTSAPDYLLVLPWHFRKYFEGSAKFSKLNLVFPLPTLSSRAA